MLDGPKPFLILVPGDQIPSSGQLRYCMHMAHIHAGKTLKHKIYLFLKKIKKWGAEDIILLVKYFLSMNKGWGSIPSTE